MNVVFSFRAMHGLTVSALAKLSGVSRQAIIRAEIKGDSCSVNNAWKLAKTIGCDVSEIVGPVSKLLRVRLSRGMTQAQVFQATGIRTHHLSALENGHIKPTAKTLAKLMQLYKCAPEDLIEEGGE